MGKTITTYLIDGNPKGSQYAFIHNKTCKMYVIPRSDLSIFFKREELQKPAFYILLGEDEFSKPKAYIGETENFCKRVKGHDNKKDFWQKALVFISKEKDSDLTKADVQFLEFKAIKEALEANNMVLNENKQIPKSPNLPEYRQDSILEFFEDVKFLASFIGCNIFNKIGHKGKHVFFLKGQKCDASGIYNQDGFIIFKGSVIAKESLPSLKWKEKREKLLKEYSSTKEGELRLTSDITLTSPSAAASFCKGRPCDGWKDWRDKNGKSLDEIYRG